MWKPESSILIEQNSDLIAIGIGSNIGHKKHYISCALRLIHSHGECELVSVSSLYQTIPWGKTDQDFFLNAVALVKTSVSPENLLDILISIENDLDRKRNELWGPRTIDLDILLHGDYSLSTDRLTIPHPYMTQRAFVMVPLSDVSPHILIDGLSIENWVRQMDISGVQVVKKGGYWWIATD
ncbi:MAG: 2-amino-4-hydroxy-6-hydroxymethyldihydropteridine diphosphokinase [Candidatus Liberibacter ctenarytainae]|uniref:2-amino-4-hydroxy-6-hydroxymethyldihydropteridine pyrophosphokinase n=1 Tax=Candidatus Liberibacter ctenarytainae TaxID=2020335 RepID=A0A937AFA0_9HYPH|nr:2-amino-4-hydroxy-6-hydroxymethyldihydropteridine diphosphokinase [Candidatus Liberibacter ctenarytainae]